jgi:FKBP-type peptidyl-prolyl cis-trans isomerase FkpA
VEVSHTKKSTRIIIWIITIVMAGGFIGTYYLVMMDNEQRAKQSPTGDATSNPDTTPTGTVDKTAYKVEADVTQLQSTDLIIGDGAEVKAGDTITAHYKGTLAKDGKKFDSSFDRGEPATFSLGGVIQGWQVGIPGMKVGGKRRLVIPSELAYGSSGTQGIPPDSDLVFEVELIAVTPAAEAQAQPQQ